MSDRTYFAITAAIFAVVSVVHLARLAMHFPLVIGGWEAPMWISIPGALVPGWLSWWGLRRAGAARSG